MRVLKVSFSNKGIIAAKSKSLKDWSSSAVAISAQALSLAPVIYDSKSSVSSAVWRYYAMTVSSTPSKPSNKSLDEKETEYGAFIKSDEIGITPAMVEAGVRFAENTLVDLPIGDSTIRYLVAGVLEQALKVRLCSHVGSTFLSPQ
jgi:hypothetical protein